MNEQITIKMNEKMRKAIDSYTSKVNISMSSYIKQLIGDDLIRKGYLINKMEEK